MKILLLFLVVSLIGCCTLSYHDKKIQEATELGYRLGSADLKQCQEAVNQYQKYIQQHQAPVPGKVK
jgi:hypothetical protein